MNDRPTRVAPVAEHDGTFGKPCGEIVAFALVAAALILAAGIGIGMWLG
jgi:hypothetical protein